MATTQDRYIGPKSQKERYTKPVMVTRWITVKMERHADLGGGTIEADLPDTEYHRHYYAGRIVRTWHQVVEA